ncbi:MAG: HEAT repeat domain-containing protein [Nitrospira sp.]|nr:HEAT repeat domain-containing protein [Nitrospira sp.]
MTEQQGASGRIEQLIQALHDDNEALRDHAIASLGQTGPEALPRLIDLMADEDAVIREAATSAVVRMGPSVVEPMIDGVAGRLHGRFESRRPRPSGNYATRER